jgi:phage shock protein A
MQTARVTILMSPAKKQAFDAIAAGRGQSVGEFFRQAGDKLADESDGTKEAELAALTEELESVLPQMREDIDAMRASIREARASIAAYRAEKAAAEGKPA